MTPETHDLTPVADVLAPDSPPQAASTDRTPLTASESFVRAVSDLLDTDPADLLQELGYYERRKAAPGTTAPRES
jgi:hypothetical protein